MNIRSSFPFVDQFEKFTADFESLESQIEHRLTEQQKPVNNVLKLLHTYFVLLNYVVETGALSDAHQAEKMLYAKTSTDIFAIYNCLKSGCLYQAIMIIRTMLETTATVLFIYGDFEKRIELFYNYRYIEQYKAMEKDSRLIREHNKASIREKNKSHMGNYDEKAPWYSKELKRITSNEENVKKKVSLRDLSKFVGIEEEYNFLYGPASMFIHGSAVVDHLLVRNGQPSVSPVFDHPMLAKIATQAVIYGHRNLQKFLSRSGYPETAEVIGYSEQLQCEIFQVQKDLNDQLAGTPKK